jgi:hypothetical protein
VVKPNFQEGDVRLWGKRTVICEIYRAHLHQFIIGLLWRLRITERNAASQFNRKSYRNLFDGPKTEEIAELKTSCKSFWRKNFSNQ